MRGGADRPALFLGCLLHDIGKGRGRRPLGPGRRARAALPRAARRSPPSAPERVVFLVQQHLLMSNVAQRRDLSDPKVIVEFARAVRRPREPPQPLPADLRRHPRLLQVRLDGVEGPAPARALRADRRVPRDAARTTPQRALEQIEERVERAPGAARGRAAGARRREREDRRLLRRHAAALLHRAHAAPDRPPRARRDGVRARQAPDDRGARDARRLLRVHPRARATCTASTPTSPARSPRRASTSSARTSTPRSSGLALEVYRVTTPAGGEEERSIAWDGLHRILDAGAARRDARRRAAAAAPAPAARGASRPRASRRLVEISNEESDFYTVVDVTADDRLGLLHDLLRTIAEHGLEIYVSKATTILDQVADTFYVKDAKRRKIDRPERLERAAARPARRGRGRAARWLKAPLARERSRVPRARRARARPRAAHARGLRPRPARLPRAPRRGRASRALGGSSAPHVAAWLAALEKRRGVGARSRARALVAVRRFARWLLATGALGRDPVRGRAPAAPPAPRCRARSSRRRSRRCSRRRDPGAPLGAARPRDARGRLRGGAPRERARRRSRSPALDRRAGLLRVVGKGRRERIVPLGEPALDALDA